MQREEEKTENRNRCVVIEIALRHHLQVLLNMNFYKRCLCSSEQQMTLLLQCPCFESLLS